MNDQPVRLVRSSSLTDAAPYAYAAIVASGSRLVLIAGACPLDEHGATVGVGDVVVQARQVMADLTLALTDAGAGLGDVARTTVHVASADRGDLGAVWDGVAAALAPHDPPSTLLGVAARGHDHQLVEAVAVLPGRGMTATLARASTSFALLLQNLLLVIVLQCVGR